MTMFQRKRLKEYTEQFEKMNAKADAKADSLLDKAKESKWTAVMLGTITGFALIGFVVWLVL